MSKTNIKLQKIMRSVSENAKTHEPYVHGILRPSILCYNLDMISNVGKYTENANNDGIRRCKSLIEYNEARQAKKRIFDSGEYFMDKNTGQFYSKKEHHNIE